MRIHFSDTHLGFAESYKVNPTTRINQREQDTYTAFNIVIDKIIEKKPDVAIHAGDLFHTPHPPNRAIVTAFVGFQRLATAGIPVVLIAGNHSVPRVATAGSLFDAFRIFPGIQSAHNGRYEVFEIGDMAVH
jgi:exonuclease SbcD